MIPRLVYLGTVVLTVVPRSVFAEDGTAVTGVNRIETYSVRWWGTEGSEMSRPIYSVTHVDNARVEVRYVIVPGRELGEYTLPYWRITSFLSIVNRPAELAHRCDAQFVAAGEAQAISFVPHGGSEFATVGEADVLSIRNRTADTPEGRDKGVTNPLLMEHSFVMGKATPDVHVLAGFTNTGDAPLQNVTPRIQYAQSFNWSDFGIGGHDAYDEIKAPADGNAQAFYAFSRGMERGYEFIAGENCTLSFSLTPEMNTWQVTLTCPGTDLMPGQSVSFGYVIRNLDSVPTRPGETKVLAGEDLLDLSFRRVQPTTYTEAPVQFEGRVMLPQLVNGLARPKVRGLNLRAGFPQALEDLETLRDWGCNLVIIGIGNPERTRQVIERGHELGMEMLVSGHGSYRDGPPRFEALYPGPVPATQRADSHGQDEDHYYWYAIQPTRDFEADFGKSMGSATQDEKVIYWTQCFRDKWQSVLAEVRRHAPNAGIWFYIPAPGIAHVDPLDYYDLFFRGIAELGEPLTVFPFYYGVEYNQAEYMVRRWKDAGARRVAFLPMRGFMTRPSQFIRAITAARRGQADGTCGFNFAVGEERPEKAWQWKSVMLAAHANFPTPELNAYCFIEEPAELVEALAVADVAVVSRGVDVESFVDRVKELLPGEVRVAAEAVEIQEANLLTVGVGGLETAGEVGRAFDVAAQFRDQSKGFIRMQAATISLTGTDETGVTNAMELFTRFAELARAERGAQSRS